MHHNKYLGWIAVLFLAVTVITTACTPTGIPAAISVNNASPKAANHEIEPTSVEATWQTEIILKLGSKTNVTWDIPQEATCFTETLGSEHSILSQYYTYASDRYSALYVDGGNRAVIYRRNSIGDLKRYTLKNEKIQNADGTITSIEEGYDRSLSNCKDTKDDASLFSMSHLYKCSLRTTTTTYRDWNYIIRGFCKGTGFDVIQMKPQPKSIANIPSESSEQFMGTVNVKLNGITVGTFNHRELSTFTGNCKVVKSPQENVLGVNCYK